MHFELPADDLARASKFYSEVFGWSLTPNPGGASALAGTTPSDEYGRPTEPGAINGGLATRGGPIGTPVVTLHVDDIDEALERIEKAGGKRVQEKSPVGDVGFVGYFSDTEGSVVGLWQFAAK